MDAALLTFAGVVVCALGAAIYIMMDVVPNPPEGLILAFCERFQKEFGRMKIVFDCIFIVLGITIGLLFAGQVIAIREGTVIAALLTGAVISFFNRCFGTRLKELTENKREQKVAAFES